MADIAAACKKSLENAKLGSGAAETQNGKDFYKYFFTNHPDLRVYFKGAENFTADDVQKSDRFERLGTGILLSCHLLAETYPNDMVFRAFVRDTINRHVDRKLDPVLWLAFWDVWNAFLATKGPIDDAQKAAWKTLGARFNEEAQSQLKKHGLPTAA